MAGLHSNPEEWLIYALRDPRTDQIRYVGRTTDPRRRYYSHIAPSQLTKSPRSNWMRELLAAGLTPIVDLLEICFGNASADSERAWIARLRKAGADLTNDTDGGGGGPSKPKQPRSEEHRRRLSKPRSPEARARIAAILRERNAGKPLPEEQRRKISVAQKGRVKSAEERAHISASRLGKKLSAQHCESLSRGQQRRYARGPISAETRAKIVAALTGRPVSPETRAKVAASLKGKTLGRKVTDEIREQIAQTLSGKPKSEAHKEALKAAWVIRRAKKLHEGGDLRASFN